MDIAKIIQETATWIEKVNKDYETNLYRTPELWPKKHIIYIPEVRQVQVLKEVVTKRSKLLKESQSELLPVENLHNYGRLMIFDINSTVCDGAPQDISNYYVDVNDTPPVDTWIAFGSQLTGSKVYKTDDELFKQSILAWVPASQYFYANEAILVACVDNFAWPKPDGVDDTFGILRPLFTEPTFEEPELPINFERRIKLMQEFEEQLDKKSNE